MVFGAAGGGHDAEHFLGRIQGGNAGDGQFHRNAAQVISFLLDLAAVGMVFSTISTLPDFRYFSQFSPFRESS